jgi:Bacterial type II/III secretion system short domain
MFYNIVRTWTPPVSRAKAEIWTLAGSIIKIIPSRDVRQSAELTQSQQPALTQGDQYVTRIVKLRNTDATSIIKVVAPSAQGAATKFSIAADERTNSLLVLASPLQMRQIKDLVTKLDIHSPYETARIHVYHLKYAAAGEIVDVLNGLLSGGNSPSSLSPTTGRNSLGAVALGG